MPGHGFPYDHHDDGDAWAERDVELSDDDARDREEDRQTSKAPMRPRGVEAHFTARERRA